MESFYLLCWAIVILGFSMVAMGLGLAHSFINNEVKKNNIVEMAYQWKAKMEEETIQKENAKLKEAA